MLIFSYEFKEDVIKRNEWSNPTDPFSKYFNNPLKDIERAMLLAAIKMRDRARYNLKNNVHGYRLDKVADKGIILGTLKKDYENEGYNPIVKLHAFGTKEEGRLARIFITGTVKRETVRSYIYKKNKNQHLNANIGTGKPLGYIKSTDAIASAVNQEILENEIKKVL